VEFQEEVRQIETAITVRRPKGVGMRKVILVLAGFSILAFSAATLKAYPQESSELQMMKIRHKQERKMLKLSEQSRNQALKNHSIPEASRAQTKHEMQKEERALREKQRNELQEFKDRKRQMKINARNSS
jgi:hypothetical protein